MSDTFCGENNHGNSKRLVARRPTHKQIVAVFHITNVDAHNVFELTNIGTLISCAKTF